MACRFCATGKEGLQRSLEPHEIVDQVLTVREVMQRRPSHVVFMGMGEPLLNSDHVLTAIDCFSRVGYVVPIKSNISTLARRRWP